jgi:hypothetical protein
MLTVTTWKNKYYYVVFFEFIKDFFCNKYVDVIWCCTFKFGPPSYQCRKSRHLTELPYLTMYVTSVGILSEVQREETFEGNFILTFGVSSSFCCVIVHGRTGVLTK